MVWALIEPSSFGDFFPDGEHVGRAEQLAAYFQQMPADLRAKFGGNDLSYKSYVSSKFIGEIGTKMGDKPAIGPLEPHEKPGWFQTEKRYSSLGSLINTENQLLAVDETLKLIIEQLEPGCHEFWPMQITMPKGEVYPKKYYGLVIGQFVESFVPEKSAEGSWEKSGQHNYRVSIADKSRVAGLALSKSAVGNSHLWRERKLRRPAVCLSDALQTAIDKSGLRIPKLFKMKEVE
jgi:hypothetical protein